MLSRISFLLLQFFFFGFPTSLSSPLWLTIVRIKGTGRLLFMRRTRSRRKQREREGTRERARPSLSRDRNDSQRNGRHELLRDRGNRSPLLCTVPKIRRNFISKERSVSSSDCVVTRRALINSVTRTRSFERRVVDCGTKRVPNSKFDTICKQHKERRHLVATMVIAIE